MLLERLDVQNVRNIESAHLELAPRINLLTGPNGAGKTALLEAVHLLIRGRSFRTNRSGSLLRHGAERLQIGASCQDGQLGSVRLSYTRERGGSVSLRRDGQPVRQSSSVAALLPIHLLLPDLSDLVFGAPASRRQWLDWGVFHVKQGHAANWRSYLRALRHRNSLLRAGGDSPTLGAWTAQLAEFGTAVDAGRRGYFEDVASQIHDCLAALSEHLRVDLDYARGWNGEELAETLASDSERDSQTGLTNSGPHRADIRIRCHGEPAATVLSRGQGKLVATAMHLGQAKGLSKTGRPSLFLIDDVGAELDEGHNEGLYELLNSLECQILATTAHLDASETMLTKQADSLVFHVKQGQFEARPKAGMKDRRG